MTEFITLTLLSGQPVAFNRKYILVISPAPDEPTLIVLKCLDDGGNVISYRVKESFKDLQRILVG